MDSKLGGEYLITKIHLLIIIITLIIMIMISMQERFFLNFKTEFARIFQELSECSVSLLDELPEKRLEVLTGKGVKAEDVSHIKGVNALR